MTAFPIVDANDNPFLHLLGVELVDWQEGSAEFRLQPQASQLNRQGHLHGGVIATLLDAACGYAGLHAPAGQPPRHGSTIALNINYIAPGGGEPLRIRGRKTGGGRRIFFAYGELLGESGVLLASAQGSFRYQSGG